MKELIRPVPIEIVDLGIETHAQIEIEEILLTSFPPIQKTILKFSTECTVFDLRTEYSIKIKNDDAVIKCYRGNTLNTFIQKDAGERTVAEWRKVISRSKNTPDIVKAIDSIKVLMKMLLNQLPVIQKNFKKLSLWNWTSFRKKPSLEFIN